MPRFNFKNLTRQTRADINDIMDNFNEIETNGITADEVSESYYNKEEIQEREEAFALQSGQVWSTNEMDTGQKWVDGKPIYRKTFKGNSILDHQLVINVSNLKIDEIFFVIDRSNLLWSNSPGDRWMPIIQTSVYRAQVGPSEPEPSRYMTEVYLNPSQTALVLNTGSNVEISKWTITIEYTKTTD